MWDLYVFARHQVAHGLHGGHTLKAPALGSRVQVVEFVALALDALSISVCPNCSREQTLARFGALVCLVDVYSVILLHINLPVCQC